MDNPGFSGSETDLLSKARVAVLGLGLMGGSLAMALKDRCATLMGIDPDEKTLALAKEKGLVDMASPDPSKLLPQSDLVILAAPVRVILRLIEDLPALHPSPAVVIDLGSTKSLIVEAMAALPERFDPLGGHPICGKESTSLANAEPGLYYGAPFALTALPRSSNRARQMARQLVHALGARPVWLDPLTHDRLTARTSHFPYVLANLLASVTPQDASRLVGSGFRSTTRVASTSASVMLDILTTNRMELLSVLSDFRLQLDLFESYLVGENHDGLGKLFGSGADRRERLLEAAEWRMDLEA
jgi:prephenate dehydrogenase